ncbi:olfactory receptor class A-like protein 1 [Phascolarctos cinereus]|uniref:Vomeronasal type-1 receptor n=1 Tax=Phascolarctos cinereus TaxID=38626 RepID=A0A6P5JU48_PHACI|nr:vomeronasal type-1 receptor 1-like [Phascolarctos cinereus]XP_020834516.1 vomeronasal type-1 receptor 1-like [Phascolarctos cinereus]XP_020834517.1 vomeronasal type-1 receptor 1-like [Phascolarctos cinereus]XP_020834518.1 vomeronasal type-1 receptor 1-like [Phascolarctos cinereus]XP_020834519.1 vomeronasal type-1 receptor 1-like [Phascolarctos cinereus]
MVSSELIFGVSFFFQCAIGFVGNSLLLMLYVYISFRKPQQKKPMDLILAHLTLANMVTLFTRGIPEIMFCFGMRHFLDDVGCKALMYFYRVARGLSVCTTSLVSMFQALIISPNNSVWASVKVRSPKYILHYFVFVWVANALIFISVIRDSEATRNETNVRYRYATHIFVVRSIRNESHNAVAFMFGMTFHDLIFHFLMGLSSTYMVLLLYRHSKQVQHIYSSSHSLKSFPEVKATQTILLLVTCFVLFYWLHNCIILYLTFNFEKDVELETIASFFGGCYPALSPLLLIGSDSRIPKLHCTPGKPQRPPKDFMNGLVNT